MRALFVTGAAPPAGGSHATRVTAFVENLASRGHSVTVVSVAWPEEMRRTSSLFKRLLSCAKVLEIDGGILRRSADAVRFRAQNAKGGRRVRAGQFFRLGKKLARRIAIPDSFIFWVPKAFNAGVNAGRDGCDVVISSGAPFSAHIAAYLISSRLGVPLVLDYGDPWVHEPGRPRSGVRRLIERALEAKILVKADSVALTTQATRLLYLARFPEIPDKYAVLPMGYSAADYFAVGHRAHTSDRCRFVYAGRLNDEYRSLDGLRLFLLHAIDSGVPFVFEFYGADEHRIIVELGEFVDQGYVEICPPLDHALYIDLLCNACCVVVFGNNNQVQVPGKVSQILAAKRPILYFPNMPEPGMDPALAMLRHCARKGLFIFSSALDAKDVLDVVSDSVLEVDETLLRELEWNAIGGHFRELVQEAVERHR